MLKEFKRIVLSMMLTVLLTSGFVINKGWSADSHSYQNISLDQFTKMLQQKDFILLDVHVPYQGEIPGTDLLISFNKIDQNTAELPVDKDRKIVIYCMTGPMG